MNGALPRPASLDDPPALLVEVEARLAAAMARLPAAPPGGLVSLSLILPDMGSRALPPGLDEDFVFWSRPAEERCLLGIGRAAAVAADGPDRVAVLSRAFERLRAGWTRCDPHGAGLPPIAFVGLSFAGETDLAAALLTVPLIAMQRVKGRCVATFTAEAPLDAAATLTRWRAAARHLLGALAAPPPPARRPPRLFRIGAEPEDAAWLERARAAVADVRAGRLAKLVLTRRVRVRSDKAFDVARLSEVLAGRYPGCAVLALSFPQGVLVAATPERLAAVEGGRVESHALAGTVRMEGNAARDGALGRLLLASPKERLEHSLVVEAIAGGLAGVCDEVRKADQPSLMKLHLLQHLWTPVEGRLRAGATLLDVVARLHPTPAVAGLPAEAAMAWLAAAGDARPAWYTGAAGWLSADGDGDISVILRSAFISGDQADLFAGAGIVAESRPEAELEETELKLRAVLEALRHA